MEITPLRSVHLAELCGKLALIRAHARGWAPEQLEHMAGEAYELASDLRRELSAEDDETQSLKRSLALYQRVAHADYDY